MSGKYGFEVGVWYMTKDYKDLYKIIQDGPVMYTVISFGDWKTRFTFPGILGVQQFMSEECFDHSNLKGAWLRDGK